MKEARLDNELERIYKERPFYGKTIYQFYFEY